MGRIKWFSYIISDEGQPIEGANVSIQLAGTSTDATIYTGETSTVTTTTSPQLVTNEDGYFEFWVGDSSSPNGYDATQKFKISFEKTGVVSGFNDHISIYPNFVPVDETSTDTTRDRTISDNLARGWENHKNNVTHLAHGIEEVDETNIDTNKNKLVSDSLAYYWENHKNLDYDENPHNIGLADETDVDSVKNKLVSNFQLFEIYTTMESRTYSEQISASSLSLSGDKYYYDVYHSLSMSYPTVNVWDTIDGETILPYSINTRSTATTRLWFNEQSNFYIKVHK